MHSRATYSDEGESRVETLTEGPVLKHESDALYRRWRDSACFYHMRPQDSYTAAKLLFHKDDKSCSAVFTSRRIQVFSDEKEQDNKEIAEQWTTELLL